jgi:hypothetical protein
MRLASEEFLTNIEGNTCILPGRGKSRILIGNMASAAPENARHGAKAVAHPIRHRCHKEGSFLESAIERQTPLEFWSIARRVAMRELPAAAAECML